jgi:hypothetical protein
MEWRINFYRCDGLADSQRRFQHGARRFSNFTCRNVWVVEWRISASSPSGRKDNAFAQKLRSLSVSWPVRADWPCWHPPARAFRNSAPALRHPPPDFSRDIVRFFRQVLCLPRADAPNNKSPRGRYRGARCRSGDSRRHRPRPSGTERGEAHHCQRNCCMPPVYSTHKLTKQEIERLTEWSHRAQAAVSASALVRPMLCGQNRACLMALMPFWPG